MIKHIAQVFILLHCVYYSFEWCLKATVSQLPFQINEVDWSPNSHYLVTASNSKRATVFSTITLDVVWYMNYSNFVTTAKFSKNGKFLGVGLASSDTIYIYNVPSFSLHRSFRTNHSSTTVTIWELDFNFNDDKVVTCGSDGEVHQIRFQAQTTDWKQVLTAGKHVYTCEYVKSGKVVAAGEDQKIYLLRSNDGNVERDTAINLNLVKDVDARPNSQRHVYAGCTCDTKIYQFDSGNSGGSNTIQYLTVSDQVWAVSFARDSSFLATGGKNGHFFIIQTVNRTGPNFQYYFKQPAHIHSVRVSDDNNKVAVSRADGVVNIYKRVCDICPIGFYGNVTCRSCNSDMVGCYTCKNSTLCYTCYLGYYLNVDNICIICRNNIQGCIQCYNDSVCANCALTYYLNGTTCSKCAVSTPQCDQCLNNGICLKCSYLTYLTPDKTCNFCNQTIRYCRTCYLEYNISSITNSTLYCSQCSNGYYALQNQCLPCPANCMTCVSGAVCLTCIQQYRLVANACTRCSVGCEACLDNGTCLQCMPTTFISTGSCLRCSFPCSTCTTSATTCSSCALGYYLPAASTTCLKCVGCPLCHPTTGVCVSCPIGRYLSNTNTCLNCLNTTSRCMICTNFGCQACQRNYYLTNLGTCQPSVSLSNCIIYKKSSTTECEHCQMGLYVDPATSTCVPCPSECVVCQATTNCKQCHIGFYLDALNSICKKCVNNCITCKTETQCLSCSDEYYLSGTQCLRCSNQIPYCNSCLNNTHCLNCFLGYRLDVSSLSCIQCVSPCATCNISGCISCEQGHFYQTNACVKCPSKCSSCLNLTFCQACITGYYLDGSNICQPCQSNFLNCIICLPTKCQVCKQNYILNISSNLCQQCELHITNCLICQNDGTCQRCRPSYYPPSDKLSCISCSQPMMFCQRCKNQTFCEQCMTGFYLNSSNRCSQCMSGCSLCSNSTICHKCDSSYLLATNKSCVSCNQIYFGCDLCRNGTGCYSCKTGFYLASSTSCVICSGVLPGCLVCSSNTICKSCDTGYFLNVSNKCQFCSSVIGCSLCNQTTGTCLQCIYGYFLNSSSVCQLCSSFYPGCQICNSTDCLKCGSGTYISSGSCSPCQAISSSCIICNSSSCLQCEAGFYLSTLNVCQKCSIKGCQLCSPTGLTCLNCQNFYYKVGNSCQFCQLTHFGCLSCINASFCITCKNGYYLHSNGTCILCESKFPACMSCSSSRCEVCDSNYFHDASSVQGDCINCRSSLPGCSICLDSLTCKLCDSGYYLQNNECLSCTTINNCLFCKDITTCILCTSDFYLKNGQCFSCSSAILGCFSCASQSMCLSCSGSYVMAGGACVQAKGVPAKKQSMLKIVTQYMNQTHLKHILYAVGQSFFKVHQNWNITTKFFLISPPDNKASLQLLHVEWGETANTIFFYTNNPLGQVKMLNNIPFIGTFQRRLLNSISQLNMKIRFQIRKQSIHQILPYLDTHQQDIAIYYSLQDPQFYRSVVLNQDQRYYLFGVVVSGTLIFMYLVKICFLIPNTEDSGEIIPHILLIKACAMVIYPNYGSYINYCIGFAQIDFPWLNSFFALHLSNLADQSPPSFKIFYQNLNIASTYLLPLCSFLVLILPLTIYIYYKNQTKSGKYRQQKSSTSSNTKFQQNKRLQKFSEFIVNLFISGLAFSSFANIIGMTYNPHTLITIQGIPYLLGVLVYLLLIKYCAQAFAQQKKISKIRILTKSSLMVLLHYSPIPLFIAIAIIDIAFVIYEYRYKLKIWTIPKIWLLSQILCNLAYSMLIFLANMLLGIIITSVSLLIVIGLDVYLIYTQHLQYQKIKIMRQEPKEQNPELYIKNLSIQIFVPKNQQLFDKDAIGLQQSIVLDSLQAGKQKNQDYKDRIKNRRKNKQKYAALSTVESQNLNNSMLNSYNKLNSLSIETQSDEDKHRNNRQAYHQN